METIENNKLIAEFMGFEIDNTEVIIPEFQRIIKFKTTEDYFESSIFKFTELKFNKSWDWLMPVIQKIEQISVNNQKVINWIRTTDKTIFEMKLTESNIEKAYIKVIEFIKCHNENNK